jgi:hypothetical protein
MARKGDSFQQQPTLWHMGFDKPCDVMRKRKGDTRWRRIGYSNLTRASAMRWFKLSKQGKCIIRRDVTREAWASALNPNNWHEAQP